MKAKNVARKPFCLIMVGLLCTMTFVGCNSHKVQRIQLVSGNTYVIEKDVDEVVITGDPDNKTLWGVCIQIASRKKDLVLTLDNVKFQAKAEQPAISCSDTSFSLTVRFKGACTVRGGDGCDGADGTSGALAFPTNWWGKGGHDGQYALACGKVIFERMEAESCLLLYGGGGGDGGDAGNSDRAMALALITDKPNGGKGGNGASALLCRECTYEKDDVKFVAGSGGRGGKSGYCKVLGGLLGLFGLGKMYGHDGATGTTPKAIAYR